MTADGEVAHGHGTSDHRELSLAERGGHVPGRPISWVVVAIVCVGFFVAGVALIASVVWLFFVGAGVVAVGTLLGGVTHAFADSTTRAAKRARAAAQAAAAQAAAADSEPARS